MAAGELLSAAYVVVDTIWLGGGELRSPAACIQQVRRLPRPDSLLFLIAVREIDPRDGMIFFSSF
jgi:hypothetical protein